MDGGELLQAQFSDGLEKGDDWFLSPNMSLCRGSSGAKTRGKPTDPSSLPGCHSELTSGASHLIWGISITVASLLSWPPPEPKADNTKQSRTFSLMNQKQDSSSFLRLAAISTEWARETQSTCPVGSHYEGQILHP